MSVDQIMRACVGDNHYIASYIVPNNVLNISKVKKEHKETLAGYLPSVKLKIRADGKRIAGYDNNGNVILIVKSYKGGEYAILKRHSTETEVAMMKDMTAGL